MKTRRILCIFIILSFMTTPLSVFAVNTPSLIAEGACVIDGQTGELLWGRNENKDLVPASMTKVMTVFLVYEALERGDITKNTLVPVSKRVSALSRDPEWSNVPLTEGGSYTVHEMLNVVLISSGCAAADALGELVAGSTEQFVDRMNRKSAELGLNAVFYDCFGGSDFNRITPKSMAKLTFEMINRYPDVLNYTSRSRYFFHGSYYNSTNRFIRGTYSCNAAVDGIKTGTTTAAGKCITISAINGGHRVIAVVMKSTSNGRYSDSKALVNYGVAIIQQKLAEGFLYINPSSVRIRIAEKIFQLPALVGNNSYYIRLRDVASILNDTDQHFSVSYDSAAACVRITPQRQYVPVGGELQAEVNEVIMLKENEQKVVADFSEYQIAAFQVGGSNYMKLQDIASVVGFKVEDDNDAGVIRIPCERLAFQEWSSDPEDQSRIEVSRFVDVSDDRWYYDAIRYVQRNAIMSGVSETQFLPDAPLNRAMMVQILYNLENRPEISPELKASFRDVTAGSWYCDAVSWAERAGIVNGYEDGQFHPEQNLTRQHIAVILYRYEQYIEGNRFFTSDPSSYLELPDTADWAKAGISWACAIRLFYDGGVESLRATDEMSRAETAYTMMTYQLVYRDEG